MRRWAIINVLVGLIVVLLAVQIVGTWARTLPMPEERTRPPAPMPEQREKGRRSAAEKGGARAAAGPDVLVASVGEKDLFDESRRPPPEEGGPQATTTDTAPLPPPSGVAVVGIRLLHGEREAFIQDATQQNKQRRLRVGDQLQSFTVKEITDGQVILTAPSGQTVTMDVELKKSGGARGPAPQVTPRSPAAGPAGAARATTITIPRPTTTSTTRPPRGGMRGAAGAAADLPSLNEAVQKKMDALKKRGSDAGQPGARAERLAAADGRVRAIRAIRRMS